MINYIVLFMDQDITQTRETRFIHGPGYHTKLGKLGLFMDQDITLN